MRGSAVMDVPRGRSCQVHQRWAVAYDEPVRRVVVVVLVAVLAGCSFTVRGPDAKQPVSEAPVCTSRAIGRLLADVPPAAVLTFYTGLMGMFTVAAYREDDDDDVGHGDPLGFGLITLTSAGAAALYWWAVGHNVAATRACRDAWARHRAWAAGRP